MKTVKVNYKIHINDKDFNRLLKNAKQLGFDHGDAGEIETVRRLLKSDGYNCDEMLFMGPNGAIIE